MPLGSLSFVPRHGAAAPAPLDGGLVVRGEIEWIVNGLSDEITALCAAIGAFARPINATAALLRFGNAVGRFEVPGLGTLHVQCGKWDEDVFEAMLADLTAVASGLPFSATQRAGLPHDRSLAERNDVLLHAFLYARHIVLSTRSDALRPALDAVLRDPHRRLVTERERAPLAYARAVDGRTLTRIAAGVEQLEIARGPSARLALARVLGGRLPVEVDTVRVEHTFDTAENRFVLELLHQILGLLQRVEDRLARPGAARVRTLAADCARLRRALVPYLRADLWRDVSRMTHVPTGSSVLQRRAGYKDALRHHLALRAAARLPIEPGRLARELLGAKDVASMYELWTYFAVVRAVEATLAQAPSEVARPRVDWHQVDVPWRFCTRWAGRVALYYNLSFSLNDPDGRRSNSVGLRPDIVLELNHASGRELHVFDAKLRIDGTRPAERDYDHDDDPEQRERTDGEDEPLSFKNEDLAKMHVYRDALPDVRSAHVLYPGEEPQTFLALDAGATPKDGVGAVPLVPGQAPVHLHALLTRLLT